MATILEFSFFDFFLPWLGADTYLLYAPVCRMWQKAYPSAITHPRHLFESRGAYDRLVRYAGDRLCVYAARFCADPAILAQITVDPRDGPKPLYEAIVYGNIPFIEWIYASFPKITHEYTFYKNIGKGGHKAVVEWFIENCGHAFDPTAFSAERGLVAGAIEKPIKADFIKWMSTFYPSVVSTFLIMVAQGGAAPDTALLFRERWPGFETRMVEQAIAYRRFDMLAFLYDHDFPMIAHSMWRTLAAARRDETMYQQAIGVGAATWIRGACADVCKIVYCRSPGASARDEVAWAVDHGADIGLNHMLPLVVWHKDGPLLEWLLQRVIDDQMSAAYNAAITNFSIDQLEFVYNAGVPFVDYQIYYVLIPKSFMDYHIRWIPVFLWLLDHGCPMDSFSDLIDTDYAIAHPLATAWLVANSASILARPCVGR